MVVTADRGTSKTTSQVLALDPNTGQQISDEPQSIVDNAAKTAWSYSIYLQDEWKLTQDLTFNFGGRFDLVDAYTHAQQTSPRANLVWKATPTTTLHAGYARYFTPPPFELVGSKDIGLFANTSGAAPVTLDSTPKPERANYYDVGISQELVPHLTLGWDNYYKTSTNLIDEGQFGAPIILTPFNYAEGRQYGSEITCPISSNPGPSTEISPPAAA